MTGFERWCQAPYGDLLDYEISDHGRVRSKSRWLVNRIGIRRFWAARILKHGVDSNGYCVIKINGKLRLVHRMVGLAFVENRENKPDINHKDADKSNNHFENLEWVTKTENMQHAKDAGLLTAVTGSNHKISKLHETMMPTIRGLVANGAAITPVAERYGVTREVITRIVRGSTWKHVEGVADVSVPDELKDRRFCR